MKLRHICEVCGKTEDLTPDESFDQGWDYPPNIGSFGVVSPRTCGDCGIDKTLYWRILIHAKDSDQPYQPTEEEIALINRIQSEPASISVTN